MNWNFSLRVLRVEGFFVSNKKSGRERRDAGAGRGGGRKSAAPNHPCLHFLFVSSTPFLTEVRARLSTLERLG